MGPFRRLDVSPLAAALVLSAQASGAAAPPSAPAGERTREIKALSAEQLAGYRSGAGMGLALAAELNGVPGPKHVLELAGPLGLSAEQRTGVQAVFDRMQAEAVRLGHEIVEAERRLDRAFAAGGLDEGALRAALDAIAERQAALRFAHLVAHLETARLLDPGQVARYGELRGYGVAEHGPHRHDDRGAS